MSETLKTIWGDMALASDDVEETTPPVEEKEEDNVTPPVEEEDDTPSETPPEESEKEDDVPPAKPEEKEDDDTPPPAEEEVNEEFVQTLDNVVNSLEDDEGLLLDEDAEYEPTPEGLSQMMKDNLENHKKKWQEEKDAEIAAIRAEYDAEDTVSYADMDTANEQDQETLMRDYYKATGYEDSEIDDKIQEVKDLEKSEKEAGIAQRYLAKQEAVQKKAAEKAQLQAKQEADKQRAEAISDFRDSILETEEIAGFKLDKKTRKEFADYLLEADKKTGKTKAQSAAADTKRRLRLAFYDFMDFNKKDFEVKATTAVTRDLKKNKSRWKSGKKGVAKKGASVKSPEVNSSKKGDGVYIPPFFGGNTEVSD